MASDSSLAQYACDHCRQRKLKCSREVPKCKNCQEWSGSCIYSRRGPIKRRPRSNRRYDIPANSDDTLNQASPARRVNADPRPSSYTASPDHDWDKLEDESVLEGLGSKKLLEDETSQTFYLGPSTTASFLAQATTDVGKMKDTYQALDLESSAESGLSELSRTFSAINFEDVSKTRANVRQFIRAKEAFFIPAKDQGLQMIKIFDKGIRKGNPFFAPPPPYLLLKLVFEPSKIQERGWLLLFNSFLLTAITLSTPVDKQLVRGLKWNTWLLLEDSSILLEASEVKIQALTIVALHSQEISTPTLCWTLMSHACQMAQNLALHLPIPGTPQNSIINRQRRCLFWSLFIVDKSLSLAFGRQSLLPGYLYKNIAPLDAAQLAEYRPHQNANTASPAYQSASLDNNFGAIYILRTLEFAKLQAEIQDVFCRDGRRISSDQVARLVPKLHEWMKVTKEATINHEITPDISEETKAVKLGIHFLTFQYHHLMIYLTRTDEKSQQICLSSARNAISLLEKLVSNSIQVFNGVVWQLLYQPFMAYFVIFGGIVSNPLSNDCFEDLELLHRVVLYFLRMHNNHPSAKKLEKVADTFTRLAETYVRHTMRNPSSNLRVPDKLHEQQTRSPLTSATLHENSSSSIAYSPQQSSSTSNFYEGSQDAFDFNSIESDPMALLNFFSVTSDHGPDPAWLSDNNFDTSTPIIPDFQQQRPDQTSALQSNDLLRELENISQNCGLDATFDWFSWDQYDSTMS